MLKFCAKIFGILLVTGGFALLASQTTGPMQWVFGGIAILCLAGLALFGSASSAEVQRRLGPLPLDRSDRDVALTDVQSKQRGTSG